MMKGYYGLRPWPALRFPGENPPQTGFPTPDTGDKKFNSRLVAPTFFPQSPSSFSTVGSLLGITVFLVQHIQFKLHPVQSGLLKQTRYKSLARLRFSWFKRRLPGDFGRRLR